MQTADLEVIKEIPGYKVILKAVLKTQIQQLVEQLADHTGEESVILTASVSDGTLSHLGSDSGKVFLQDHDDIKTQFLGFCLKRHHKLKQQEKEKQQQQEKLLEASNRLMNIPTTPTRYGTGIRPRFTPTRVQTSPRQPQFSPRFQTSPRPPFGSPNQGRMQSAPRLPTVPVSGSSPEGAQRVGIDSVRHEPYPQVRPRRTSLNFNQQGRSPNPNPGVNQKQSVNTMRLPTEPQKVPKINIDPNEVIKIEAADDDDVEEVVQVKTKSKTESTAKQPENVSSEMGIKIASVSGATETEVTADPVSHETLKTSESAVSETSTLSSAPSPSTSTPAISSAMPVLSPIPKDESSNSSAATLPNETADSKVNDIPPEGLSLDSDLSKLTGIPNDGIKTDEKSNSSSAASSVVGTVSQESGSGTEPSVNVKVEALTESEMELEITGIEPGQVKQGASNVQSGIDFGPSTSGLSGMGEGVGSEMNPEYKSSDDGISKTAKPFAGSIPKLQLMKRNPVVRLTRLRLPSSTIKLRGSQFRTQRKDSDLIYYSETDDIKEDHKRMETKPQRRYNSVKRLVCGRCSQRFFLKYTLKLHLSRCLGKKYPKKSVGNKSSSNQFTEYPLNNDSGSRQKNSFSTDDENPPDLISEAQKSDSESYGEPPVLEAVSRDGHMADEKSEGNQKDKPPPQKQSFSKPASEVGSVRMSDVMKDQVEMTGQHKKTRVQKLYKQGHVCVYCRKLVDSMAHLREHIRTHTGERPFPCNFCDKRFAKKGNLQAHIKSCHDTTNASPKSLFSESTQSEFKE